MSFVTSSPPHKPYFAYKKSNETSKAASVKGLFMSHPYLGRYPTYGGVSCDMLLLTRRVNPDNSGVYRVTKAKQLVLFSLFLYLSSFIQIPLDSAVIDENSTTGDKNNNIKITMKDEFSNNE
ncbi:hypothetical protein MG293_006860 [Ovis ammon polii]|uniref:Uncharacterized protein n=1 Tax=Ovis ammon polii TaxID=230172 RepID=A0AAD4UEL7_OVIAM|nr:hypothetical protein MG293_006860 [Ovis ammon polii]